MNEVSNKVKAGSKNWEAFAPSLPRFPLPAHCSGPSFHFSLFVAFPMIYYYRRLEV
jgi:hypothetical protein